MVLPISTQLKALHISERPGSRLPGGFQGVGLSVGGATLRELDLHPEPPEDQVNFDADNGETVARRIVMSRQTWEQLERMAEVLCDTRDLDISAVEVARVALEAGLLEVKKGITGAAPVAEKKKSASGASSRPSSGRASRAAAKAGSGRQKRSGLDAEQKAELEALLADETSVRARQRTIAMWLGHHNKKRVDLELFREIATGYDAYNVANFAQNMKKDGQFFDDLRDADGARRGWRLTKVGAQAIKERLEALLVTA